MSFIFLFTNLIRLALVLERSQADHGRMSMIQTASQRKKLDSSTFGEQEENRMHHVVFREKLSKALILGCESANSSTSGYRCGGAGLSYPPLEEVSNATKVCTAGSLQCMRMKLSTGVEQHQSEGPPNRPFLKAVVFIVFLLVVCGSVTPTEQGKSGELSDFTGAPLSSGSPSVVPKSLFPNKPIPICPQLVTADETWYTVGLDSIDCAEGPVPIYGRGQKLLLTAQIRKERPGAGSVTLAMGDTRAARAGSVTLTMGDACGPRLASINSSVGHLMIQDMQNRPYGKLTVVGHLAYSLTCDGIEIMKIRTDRRTGRVLLVNPSGGTQLASAAKMQDDFCGLPAAEDHLGIVVAAGMDPILTIVCIIGAMALTT